MPRTRNVQFHNCNKTGYSNYYILTKTVGTVGTRAVLASAEERVTSMHSH